MEQNKQITMGISTSGMCLSIGTSLVNSLRLLCLLYSFVPFWTLQLAFSNPPLFWHLCIVLTNLHHLYTEFHEKSEQIILAVCKGTTVDCRQSKQSEFTWPITYLLFLKIRYWQSFSPSFAPFVAHYALFGE